MEEGIWTELHWIEGAWSGKLAIAARRRGGDWLDDEIAPIVSLLTR